MVNRVTRAHSPTPQAPSRPTRECAASPTSTHHLAPLPATRSAAGLNVERMLSGTVQNSDKRGWISPPDPTARPSEGPAS